MKNFECSGGRGRGYCKATISYSCSGIDKEYEECTLYIPRIDTLIAELFMVIEEYLNLNGIMGAEADSDELDEDQLELE